ncbi:MAG: class I SAM-dependent methyltransferase [Bacteroidales bacterium]
MEFTQELFQFIEDHISEDPSRLILNAKRYPNIDVPFCVEQIIVRRQVKDKLPSWSKNPKMLFPSKLASEQCSSELAAKYKQRLVMAARSGCDLTGGLGIDSSFLAQGCEKFYYFERFPLYCQVAKHNFNELGLNQIEVIEGDSTKLFESLPQLDFIYVDPARRSDCNKRIFELTDCEPDVSALYYTLLNKAKRLIVKLSPMADINRVVEILPDTIEIHVVSVKNECKELLVVVEQRNGGEVIDPPIYCVNFSTNGEENFLFTRQEEKEAQNIYVTKPELYLYEPNVSLLKAGAFKTIVTRYRLKKLHKHSHLYTSDELIEGFPGRRFRIESTEFFSKKWLQGALKVSPQANIATRNFPMSVEELRKRSKISDGGELYLFATTMADDQKVIIYSRKV